MSLYRWYIQKRETLLHPFKTNVFIAVARLDEYEAARNIMLGFADVVATQYRKNHEFKSITSHGDKDKLIQKLREAFTEPYTMILSIGAETTLLVQSVSNELLSTKPVGFIDIQDPLRLGIINSYDEPNNNFFGFVDSVDHVNDHVYRLRRMIPRLEHVFLVYDPLQEQGFSELEKARFVAAFTHVSVEVTPIPATAEEIKNGSVDAHVRRIHKKYHYNAIVTLRDPLIMSLMEVLSHSAEAYQVPLYSADPESVLAFAAIASGYKGYDMGSQFATKSLPKIKERRRPLLIPTTLYSLEYKSYANRTIMQRQGLEITDENREWFTHHVVYTPFL